MKILNPIFAIIFFISTSACYSQNKSMKKVITSSVAPSPIGPYSHAILAGNTLYVSGQVAKKADTGELVLSDIKSETHQVMKNVGAILKEAGMDYSDIVKTTIFLTDMNSFAQVNEVYGSYFSGNFPARETVQVSKLPLGVNIEISVTAVK